MRLDWFPDWSREICVLVGAGPSATADAVAELRGQARVLAINTSYQLAPWADALYACDGRWWKWHEGAPEFAGMKVTHDADVARHYGLRRISLLDMHDPQAHRLVLDPPGLLGRGENSGFQALNLLLQFGARRIGLLGIDFTGERWHGAHPNNPHRRGQNPDTLRRWREIFDQQAAAIAALGADVVNLSGISELQAFPRMSFAAARERWGGQGTDNAVGKFPTVFDQVGVA